MVLPQNRGHRVRGHPTHACRGLPRIGKVNGWRDCRSTDAALLLRKDIERPVELCVTSASKRFWINVHKNVRLHA